MKAVEAVKEKFYCFLGIVHPTVYNTVGEPDYKVSAVYDLSSSLK